MHKFQRVLVVLGVIAAVVLVGIGLGWWGSRGKPASIVQPGTETPVAPTPGVETHSPAVLPKREQKQPTELTTRENPPELFGSATNLITDWEDKVDEILTSDGEDADKIKKMLAMFPRLPEDGQVEVAQHLSNLLPDENYAPLGEYLKDSKLPEAVLDVLLADLLNRPNSVKLPMLVEVARDPQHAKATESKDLLELFLEEDYGTDWTKWQAKAEEWLKDNPD